MDNEFCKLLTEYRKDVLTVAELADIVGLDKKYIHGIAGGRKKNVSLHKLRDIVLAISYDYTGYDVKQLSAQIKELPLVLVCLMKRGLAYHYLTN